MATAFGTTYRFRPPGTTGMVARLAVAAASLVLGAAGTIALALSARDDSWTIRAFVADQASLFWLYPGPIDTLVWLYTTVTAVAGICWLVWQYRAQANLWATTGVLAATPPAMTVLWWFIPFANLWKPYVCLKELSSRSASAARGDDRSLRRVIAIWWSLWVAAQVLATVATVGLLVAIFSRWTEVQMGSVGIRTADVAAPLRWLGVAYLVYTGAGVIAVPIIARIDRWQSSMGEPGPAPTSGDLSPRPDTL